MLYESLFESTIDDDKKYSPDSANICEDIVMSEAKFNPEYYSSTKRFKNQMKNGGRIFIYGLKKQAELLENIMSTPLRLAQSAEINSFKTYYNTYPNCKTTECKISMDPVRVGKCVSNFKAMIDIADKAISNSIKEAKKGKTINTDKVLSQMYNKLTGQSYSTNTGFGDQLASYIKYFKRDKCKAIKFKDVPLDDIIGAASEKYFKRGDIRTMIACYKKLEGACNVADKQLTMVRNHSNEKQVTQSSKDIDKILKAVNETSFYLNKCVEVYLNWGSRVVNPYFRNIKKVK